MATTGIQVPGNYDVADIPHGCGVFRTFPYAFIPLELLLGAWVWILVAATRVFYPIVQGWVMYVAVSSFFFSLLLLMVYLFGFHRNHCNTWRIIDVIYTGITAIFYLSAAVLQAYATILCDYTIAVALPNIFGINQCFRVLYHLDAAATFFAFLTSLIYMLHSFQSYVRWKSSEKWSRSVCEYKDHMGWQPVLQMWQNFNISHNNYNNIPNILDIFFVYFSIVYYKWDLFLFLVHLKMILLLLAMNGEVCLLRQANQSKYLPIHELGWYMFQTVLWQIHYNATTHL